MAGKRTESLADYVRRVRNEKHYSQPDVERNSGFTITDGYVSQIENGYIKNVSPEKLAALAKGLGVSEEELFAVARGISRVGEMPLDEVRVLECYRILTDERKANTLAHLELEARLSGKEREREMLVKEGADFNDTTTIRKRHRGRKSGRTSTNKR